MGNRAGSSPVARTKTRHAHKRMPYFFALHTTLFPGQAVFEVTTMNHSSEKKGKSQKTEKDVSKVYPVIDNDLARDNVENDLPAADLEDL